MDDSTEDTKVTDQWIIEIVEMGLVGEYTSHVVDLAGITHIFYFDHLYGNLKHARRGPDGWAVETVDQEGTVGQYLSTARDEIGKLYISYRDQGKNRLKMAIFDGSGWNFEIVDNEPFASFDTSTCVDALGKVYVSYYNFSNGYLKLAVRDEGRWKTEIVDGGQGRSSAVGSFTSMKLDSGGRVHISYFDSVQGLLKYAVKGEGSWNIEVADDSEFVSNFTSLALDKAGNPYISYTVDKAPNKPDLWVARKLGGKWINELVDTQKIVGNYSSIAVDEQSNIYISYSAMSKLKLAINTGGIWHYEIIDPDITVTYTSLLLDKSGMPHIAYHNKEQGVKYAYKMKGL